MEITLPYPIKAYLIPSKSEPGRSHRVTLWSDDKLACDCIAGGFKKNCKHKEKVRKHIKNAKER